MRFFAPGKIVIMGEYSVVDGGSSLVAGIDHGVTVQVKQDPNLQITTPTNDFFVRPAIQATGTAHGAFVFSDTHPPYNGQKIGVGGSAAATVAAITAAYALRGEKIDRQTLFTLAHRVHKNVQGSGSGVDIAASVWGGLLRFQGGKVTAKQGPMPLLVWSGESAKTGPRVVKYQHLEDHYRQRFRERSNALVEQYEDNPITALNENGTLLHEMAQKAGISYLTPTLKAIVTLAQSLGGGAKPSGAGGGDCALALFHDASQEREFVHQLDKIDAVCVIPTALSTGVKEL